MLTLFKFLLILMMAFLIENHLLAVHESVDLDVSAQCFPHSEVKGASSLNVTFFFGKSSSSVLDVESFLSIDSVTREPDLGTRWNLPEKGWIAALFNGPPLEANFYCQESSDPKSLHLTYHRQGEVKIFISQDDHFSHQELDASTGPTRNSFLMTAEGKYQNEYHAGAGTKNPYYLQFAIPVHQISSGMETAIQYEFP